MTVLAGFDAGQTHTRCRISRWDADGWTTLGEGRGPGVSHLDAAAGEQHFVDALSMSAKDAGYQHGEGLLTAAVIGASGIEHGSPLERRAAGLVAQALNLPVTHVAATGDERTALRGAFPNGAGIVLISGTGMICLGRNNSGVEHRCGGWGWRLDGAGAAFDLGHQGLQLTLQMADGRLPDHDLRRQLWTELGCNTSADIKALVVQPSFGPANFAQLAPSVVAAADAGLSGAQAIVTRSAQALAASVTTVSRTLQLTEPAVVGLGGALTHLPSFQNAVANALGFSVPGAQWASPSGDACSGALTMAQELSLKRH